MKSSEATNLGCEMAGLIQTNRLVEAHQRLAPILAARTPFALLDRIGEAIGRGTGPAVNEFLDQVAAGRSMGGWPLIGSALRQQLGGDLHGAFERCQAFIIQGDTWYATDSLGERVPGPALVDQFEAALYLLARWGEDQNRWVRRAVGVSVHLWAKRARGDAEKAEQAGRLLGLLEALFSEGDMDAVKGIGWGLKTLGRYYPELTADWLRHQVANRPYRAMMLRKALTYLPPEQRASIEKAARGERSG
jgi:3-methyladenine DNA glycosylase AlkD